MKCTGTKFLFSGDQFSSVNENDAFIVSNTMLFSDILMQEGIKLTNIALFGNLKSTNLNLQASNQIFDF
jgi:hypothetical protein